jgi:hypothetical protein
MVAIKEKAPYEQFSVEGPVQSKRGGGRGVKLHLPAVDVVGIPWARDPFTIFRPDTW